MWRALTLVCLFFAGIADGRQCFTSPETRVKHPAGLMGPKQLHMLPSRRHSVAAKKLMEWAPLSFKARVVENVNVEKFGGGIGHYQLVESGEQAYKNAVLYAMTGDKRRAMKTLEIVDAWSTRCKTFKGPNAILEGSWFLAPMVRAVELIKYTDEGKYWNPHVGNRFKRFVDKLIWPHLTKKLQWRASNWHFSQLEATLMYRLHRSNASVIQDAARVYKQQHNDGIDDKGITVDIRRDPVHSMFSLGSLVNVAEILWIHRIDVYSYRNDLLAKMMELNAGILLGEKSPVKQDDPDAKWYQPVWAIGYNHYVNRMGLSMPKTRKVMAQHFPEPTTFQWGLGSLTHTNTSNRHTCKA